jgi:NADPH2:quinone reductase
VQPFEVSRLAARSASLSRPILFHYIVERAALERLAMPVFEAVLSGVFPIEAGRSFPLAEAGAAHRTLEMRQAEGPLLLMP